jgi:hypothetical protein
MSNATASLTTGQVPQVQAKSSRSARLWKHIRKYPTFWVGLLVLIFFGLVIVFADQIAPIDPLAQNLAQRLKPPTAAHNFGTDELGRDIFSRVVHGARISLPAIRKITSLPAQREHLDGRGLLKPGYFADITIFDPASTIDHATFTKPDLLSEGIDFTIVNGQIEYDHGKLTGLTAGRVLRGRGWQPAKN